MASTGLLMLMFSPPAPVISVGFAVGPGRVPTIPRTSPTSREEHAHLLQIAAARRLRAVERAGAARAEDAEYWKAVAPAAVAKAVALRAAGRLSRLPA